MAIVQTLLAFLFRSAGRVLNTAFGWATVMIFGKVPQDRQIYLSVIAFGSVGWIVAVLGIIFPSFATFLLAFVPLPDQVSRTWVRLAMLGAAVVIPLVVGFVSTRMLDPADRPKGAAALITEILKGYPYTVALAITLVMMTVLAPLMRLRTMAKRWTTRHIPVIVESDDYLAVVADVEKALDTGGFQVERRPASWTLRFPTRVLTALAGGAVDDLVAEKLTSLESDRIEVLLHPSDLVISGRSKDAARANAILAQQLAFSQAYLTWTKEANEIEDRLRRIWVTLRQHAKRPGVVEHNASRLAAVEHDLQSLDLPYEEWEVLFRQKLMVERALLQLKARLVDHPLEPADAPPERLDSGIPLSNSTEADRHWWSNLLGS